MRFSTHRDMLIHGVVHVVMFIGRYGDVWCGTYGNTSCCAYYGMMIRKINH